VSPELAGGEIALRSPAALLLLGLALWAALRILRRPAPRMAWPAWPEARAAGAGRSDPDPWLRAGLRGLAMAALVVAVAEPVTRRVASPPLERGLDLVLVVDASGSMRALDAAFGGEFDAEIGSELGVGWGTRLDLAREVVARFAQRRAASGDRVGLVVFGEQAFTQCPLTRDGALLAASLERVRAGVAGENTALGDALALAVKRVAARRGAHAGERVVVLLTDGRSNAGEIPVDVATALARSQGVRVHTVGIGGEGRVAMERPEGAARRGLHFARQDLDTATLREIAEHTGGRFFRASRPADLGVVYEAIDGLERSERPAELRRLETPRLEPWLALGGGLVALELLLLSILRRPLP